MSQYGYIPQSNVHQLQEEYSIATPQTWTFTKGEVGYGGVEENEFSEAQRAELIALGGNWFTSSQEFLNWLNG